MAWRQLAPVSGITRARRTNARRVQGSSRAVRAQVVTLLEVDQGSVPRAVQGRRDQMAASHRGGKGSDPSPPPSAPLPLDSHWAGLGWPPRQSLARIGAPPPATDAKNRRDSDVSLPRRCLSVRLLVVILLCRACRLRCPGGTSRRQAGR